jgi:hypothetical protein
MVQIYKSKDSLRISKHYKHCGSLLEFLMLLVKSKHPEIFEITSKCDIILEAAKPSLKQMNSDMLQLEAEFVEMKMTLESLSFPDNLEFSCLDGAVENVIDRPLSGPLRNRLQSFLFNAEPIYDTLREDMKVTQSAVKALLDKYPAIPSDDPPQAAEDQQLLFNAVGHLIQNLQQISLVSSESPIADNEPQKMDDPLIPQQQQLDSEMDSTPPSILLLEELLPNDENCFEAPTQLSAGEQDDLFAQAQLEADTNKYRNQLNAAQAHSPRDRTNSADCQ